MFFWMLRRKKPWVQRAGRQVSHTHSRAVLAHSLSLRAEGQATAAPKPLAMPYLRRPDKTERRVRLQGRSKKNLSICCLHTGVGRGFPHPAHIDLASPLQGKGTSGCSWVKKRGRWGYMRERQSSRTHITGLGVQEKKTSRRGQRYTQAGLA